MITTAKHYARSQYEPSHELVETRHFGTRDSALQWARHRLGTIQTTRDCYWRDVARGNWIDLYEQGKQVQCVESRVEIVPSVGELGWTP